MGIDGSLTGLLSHIFFFVALPRLSLFKACLGREEENFGYLVGCALVGYLRTWEDLWDGSGVAEKWEFNLLAGHAVCSQRVIADAIIVSLTP